MELKNDTAVMLAAKNKVCLLLCDYMKNGI